MVKEILFETFLIYSSGGHLVWQSRTVYGIKVECIMRNISVTLQVVEEEMLVKDFFTDALGRIKDPSQNSPFT